MDTELTKILEESILAVYNEKGEDIPFKSAKIKYNIENKRGVKNRYPSLYLDNILCCAKNKKIKYVCPNCKTENTILLKRFLTKESKECKWCKELNENKRQWHSDFFKTGKIKEKKQIEQHIFEDETIEFKKAYFDNHLTKTEFNNVLSFIVSINGYAITDETQVFYEEHHCVNNQYKYSPMVWINGVSTPFINVMLECPNCGSTYKISDSRRKKEKLLGSLYCRKCSFNNLTFPIISYHTIFGDTITYQGNLELKFIKICEEKGVRILNGPEIRYYWNNKERIYYVDFTLPQYDFLIEIKENHIWHLEQVKSGKWDAKETSAKNYAKQHNQKFELLFGNGIENFIKNIINI